MGRSPGRGAGLALGLALLGLSATPAAQPGRSALPRGYRQGGPRLSNRGWRLEARFVDVRVVGARHVAPAVSAVLERQRSWLEHCYEHLLSPTGAPSGAVGLRLVVDAQGRSVEHHGVQPDAGFESIVPCIETMARNVTFPLGAHLPFELHARVLFSARGSPP